MIVIDSKIKKYIEILANKYSIIVEWDTNISSTFQEQVFKSQNLMILKDRIKVDDFNYLFNQHGLDYSVTRDQEMFLFNALHGIGHFVLDLWKPQTSDQVYNRLVNFDQDRKVDSWAYQKLLELRSEYLHFISTKKARN